MQQHYPSLLDYFDFCQGYVFPYFSIFFGDGLMIFEVEKHTFSDFFLLSSSAMNYMLLAEEKIHPKAIFTCIGVSMKKLYRQSRIFATT